MESARPFGELLERRISTDQSMWSFKTLRAMSVRHRTFIAIFTGST